MSTFRGTRSLLARRSLRALGVAAALGLLLAAPARPSAGMPAPASAAAPGLPGGERPFSLPFAGSPGPSTWYFVQGFGNTEDAYNERYQLYAAGQGLHFGVDFAAPCGTPVLAIGDGVVAKVDAPEHRSLPHNLMLLHPNGLASFYGHLLEAPRLVPGQAVTRGEVVGLSGDSYGSCHSAPHLHLELRDPSFRVAYNPVLFIDADWDNLALTLRGVGNFARDLDDPRRWQYLDDQPDVLFGGPMLNDYARVWPPVWR